MRPLDSKLCMIYAKYKYKYGSNEDETFRHDFAEHKRTYTCTRRGAFTVGTLQGPRQQFTAQCKQSHLTRWRPVKTPKPVQISTLLSNMCPLRRTSQCIRVSCWTKQSIGRLRRRRMVDKPVVGSFELSRTTLEEPTTVKSLWMMISMEGLELFLLVAGE